MNMVGGAGNITFTLVLIINNKDYSVHTYVIILTRISKVGNT